MTDTIDLPPWLSLLGAAFAAGGCVAMWMSRRLWKLATQSKSWPSVPGTIVASSVSTSETSTDPDSLTTYRPEVEYEYVVDGQTLRSRRIKFGGVAKTTNLEKARAQASQYPTGGTVIVYYDPEKPGQATLDQTISFAGVMILFLFGLIFVIVGGAILAIGLFAKAAA